MPLSVKIIEEALVAVPPTAALPPRDPIRLSALDAQWITLPLIQRVLIFVNNDDDASSSSIPPFASAVAALRSSLAETLARFPTLAGRIVHVPATGDAAFDCGAGTTAGGGGGGGVRFLVAEASDTAADDAARRLMEDEEHDVEALARLVPALDTGVLPAETMAAQVTWLRGGGGAGNGIAVGVAMHHAAVDGRSVWRFLRAWAAACRGEGDADAALGPPTTFDRAVIRLPGGGGEELARSVLRKCAPELPVAAMAGHFVRPNLSRRTFTITAQDMHRLKQHVAASLSLSPAHHAQKQNAGGTPSSFVAVAALAWVSFVRSKRHPAGTISAADEVYLFFFADCRARLDPPPGDGYFGTCISGCLARATAGDLLADDGGLGVAAAAVAQEVCRAAEDPLAGWDWMTTMEKLDMDRLMNLAGSTRFPAYEVADFGWGPPARTELVTMNHDGQVVLVAGKGGAGAGGVQASVSLHPAHMDAYKAHFLSYFG